MVAIRATFGCHTLGRGFDPHIDSIKNGQHRKEGWFTDRVSAPAPAWHSNVTGQGPGYQVSVEKGAYGCTVAKLTRASSPLAGQKWHWHFLGMYSDRTVRGSNRESLRDVRPRLRANRAVLGHTLKMMMMMMMIYIYIRYV